MTDWPRGVVEQELTMRALEQQVARLTHIKESLVVHSYFEPSRAEWERAYLENYELAEPPIPPGMRLCWYDMRNGIIRQFMTTYDQENGLSTSGTIYPAVRNQRPQALRLIGSVTVDGRVSPASNNHPLIVIGSNIATQKRRGLAMMDIFLRVKHGYVNDGTKFWFDFGNDVLEAQLALTSSNDTTRMYGRAANGVLSAVQAFDNNFPRESEMVTLPESPDAANGATQFPAILVHMRVFNPFNWLVDDVEFAQHTNNVIFGTVYSFTNAFAPTTVYVTQHVMTHFMLHRLHAVKLGPDWRINFRRETGALRVTPVSGDGWVYGYYTQTNTEELEFTDVI